MCAFPKIRKEKSIHSVNGLDLTDKKFITIKQITHICCLRTVRSRYEVYNWCVLPIATFFPHYLSIRWPTSICLIFGWNWLACSRYMAHDISRMILDAKWIGHLCKSFIDPRLVMDQPLLGASWACLGCWNLEWGFLRITRNLISSNPRTKDILLWKNDIWIMAKKNNRMIVWLKSCLYCWIVECLWRKFLVPVEIFYLVVYFVKAKTIPFPHIMTLPLIVLT